MINSDRTSFCTSTMARANSWITYLGSHWLHSMAIVVAMASTYFAYRMVLRTEGTMEPYLFVLTLFLGSALLDIVLGEQRRNVPRHLERRIATSWTTTLIPVLATIIGVIGVVISCIALGDMWQRNLGLFLGCAIAVGVMSGAITIVCAHELIHKKSPTLQSVGATALCFTMYGSFFREHIYGHHNDVATPEDPSSARLGQSIYAFLPFAVSGNLKKAWLIEQRLAIQEGRRLISWRNVTLLQWLFTLSLLLVFTVAFGIGSGVLFLIQGVVAIGTLETINYVQHYGLRRKQLVNGGFEPVQHEHAFSSSYWFSNLGFLNLLRHADHHVYARRPYAILAHKEEGPLLPLPAFLMMVLAYLPPVWRALMDERVMEVRSDR